MVSRVVRVKVGVRFRYLSIVRKVFIRVARFLLGEITHFGYLSPIISGLYKPRTGRTGQFSNHAPATDCVSVSSPVHCTLS